MLSHAPGVAYTTFLVLFCSLGFLPIAALRAQMGPPALGVNLGYGFTSEALPCCILRSGFPAAAQPHDQQTRSRVAAAQCDASRWELAPIHP